MILGCALTHMAKFAKSVGLQVICNVVVVVVVVESLELSNRHFRTEAHYIQYIQYI